MVLWTLLFTYCGSVGAYEVIERTRAPGEPAAIGACGTPLPPESSRRARDHRLVCGGAIVNLPLRTAVKTPQYDEWSRLERSDAAGTLETRRQMQALRLTEDPLHYQGQTSVQTYETWTTSVRMRGANPRHCRTWQRPYLHRYVVKDPIRERRCREVADRPHASSSSSGWTGGFGAPFREGRRSSGGGGARGGSSSSSRGGGSSSSSRGGGSSSSRSSGGPRLGPKMDSGRIRTWDSHKSSPSRSKSSGGYKSNRRAALEWLSDLILPRAYAERVCESVIVGYRDRTVEETRYQTMVDTCEWEEDRTESRACSTETVNFDVEFEKPSAYDPHWTPDHEGYHNLLPNKYDLLPGEWESYALLINAHARGPQVVTEFDVTNGWNAYRAAPPTFRCEKNRPIDLKFKVQTKHRIVRRAPNALDEVIDGQGVGRGVQREVSYLGDAGAPVLGRPYRLQLTDRSNQTMLTAARQSRKFGTIAADVNVTEVPNATRAATARDLGFVKNTLLKIKIIEKGGCFGEGEKVFADVLNTTADLTKAEGDTLLVPLDGSQAGIPSYYRPFGFVGAVLGRFGPLDLKLNPGLAYEFRISMLQQGLPFYKNGCRFGQLNCDEKTANARMFSEELKIRFTADPRRDDRAWWQRFEHWYGKKWWNKYRSCGGAS